MENLSIETLGPPCGVIHTYSIPILYSIIYLRTDQRTETHIVCQR